MTLALPISMIDIQGAIGWRLRAVAAAILLCTGALCSTSRADADDYRLSVGDVISFDFVDDTLPPQQLPISSAGELTVPYIGGLKVAGLTLPEALKAIDAALVKRKIFTDPQVVISVASFRPIFVVGDVKTPGSFPYQPFLTVEQAVALAGGQSAGDVTGEDRVVTAAKLRGNLAENEVEIARAAVGAARLAAQLAGRKEISPGDLAPEVSNFVSPQLVHTLLVNEQKILDADQSAFETRRNQLTAAVAEVKGALANLDQLAQKQKQVIASARAEYDRAKILNQRGLKTLTDLANVERDATTEEAHLLQIYNQESTTRREMGDLQRQLQDLTDTRARTALSSLQDQIAETKKLMATRRSTEEQLLLLSNIATEELQKTNTLKFTYQIRRKIDGQVQTRSAALDDAVLPGDIVHVYIDQLKTGVQVPRPSAALQLVQ